MMLRGKRFKRMKTVWIETIAKDIELISVRLTGTGLPQTYFDMEEHLYFLTFNFQKWQSAVYIHRWTRVFNLEFINLMHAHNVHIWCVPVHTTHWLPPIALSLSESLKRNWTQESMWLTRLCGGSKLSLWVFLFVCFSIEERGPRRGCVVMFGHIDGSLRRKMKMHCFIIIVAFWCLLL